MLRKIGIALTLGLTLFSLVTLVALEGQEVVELDTFNNSETRTTRTWIAEDDGSLWIESGNAERGFYRDISAGSFVEMQIDGATERYAATIVENPAGHRRIRKLLREKYGWADVWVGLLVDTSQSIAIRLEPAR